MLFLCVVTKINTVFEGLHLKVSFSVWFATLTFSKTDHSLFHVYYLPNNQKIVKNF